MLLRLICYTGSSSWQRKENLLCTNSSKTPAQQQYGMLRCTAVCQSPPSKSLPYLCTPYMRSQVDRWTGYTFLSCTQAWKKERCQVPASLDP